MGKRSETESEEPLGERVPRARRFELVPIHAFHKGPRRVEVALRGRTHVSTRPHAYIAARFCLHLPGRPHTFTWIRQD
jgi:hypothetical protein